MITNNKIPICEYEFQMTDDDVFSRDNSIENELSGFIEACCWAVTIFDHSTKTTTVKMNLYDLYEKLGCTFNIDAKEYIPNEQYDKEDEWRDYVIANPSTLLEQLKVNDELHVYMFGNNRWKVVFKKMGGGEIVPTFFEERPGCYSRDLPKLG